MYAAEAAMSVQMSSCWMTLTTLFTQKLDHKDLGFALFYWSEDSAIVYQAIEQALCAHMHDLYPRKTPQPISNHVLGPM